MWVSMQTLTGLVHTVVCIAGNVSDATVTKRLLQGEEAVVFADAGYTSVPKRAGLPDKELEGQIAANRGSIKKPPEGSPYRMALEALEKAKASMRAKEEHPFHVVKNLFRHRKVRYKELAKNEVQLFTLFGLANLLLARRHFAGASRRGAP